MVGGPDKPAVAVRVERGARSAHVDLGQAALLLNRATEVQDILETATRAAQDIVGTHQAVSSRLVDGWTDAPTYVALSDKYADYHSYEEPPDGLGVLNYVTRENRPLRLTGEELQRHPEWRGLRDAPGHPPLPDYLAAPFVSRSGANLGLVQLSDKVDGTPFTEDDEAILVQVAQMASAAIENVELIASERRERHVAETLHAVGAAINRRRDLQSIVQEVTDACTLLTSAQFGAFFYNIVESSGEQFLLYTLSGAPRSAFEHFPHPRATDIFRPTFHGTHVMRIDDVTQHPDFGNNDPYFGMPDGHLPVRSYLAVPVRLSDDSIAGGLFFGHADAGVFTADHERIVTGVAAHAAIAIENVRLLDSERWAREQAEERAHAARSLEHVADGVFLVDDDDVVRVWNPAAARITGAPADEVVGRRIADVVLDWPALSARLRESEEDADPRVLPLVVGQRERWVAMHAACFGEGAVYTFRDVTAERRLEQIRSDMIATVSHELRTPLASVYGAARTLQRTDVTLGEDLRAQLLEMVATECERLNRIVDEFLLASSLDGAVQFAQDQVDLRAVAADVVQVAAARAPDGVVVELVAPDADAVLAVADEPKLRQVAMNLADNALKYGVSGGRVEVAVTAAQGSCTLSVRDFGLGIPSDEQERIFERFYRLDPQLAKGVSGTGLGLYISRELVDRMGGRLELTSQPAPHTTFAIHLPAST